MLFGASPCSLLGEEFDKIYSKLRYQKSTNVSEEQRLFRFIEAALASKKFLIIAKRKVIKYYEKLPKETKAQLRKSMIRQMSKSFLVDYFFPINSLTQKETAASSKVQLSSSLTAESKPQNFEATLFQFRYLFDSLMLI